MVVLVVPSKEVCSFVVSHVILLIFNDVGCLLRICSRCGASPVNPIWGCRNLFWLTVQHPSPSMWHVHRGFIVFIIRYHSGLAENGIIIRSHFVPQCCSIDFELGITGCQGCGGHIVMLSKRDCLLAVPPLKDDFLSCGYLLGSGPGP